MEPEWQSGKRTVFPRKCRCSRRTGDPTVQRVADALAPGMTFGWFGQPHCESGCKMRHLVWQYAQDDAWWQRHAGLFTVTEIDAWVKTRPLGPTADDIREANGA